MKVVIEGQNIYVEKDFHRQFVSQAEFPNHYGYNLDALWDSLSVDVERPLHLVWRDATLSRERLGKRFDLIISVLARVVAFDAQSTHECKFTFEVLD